MDEVADKWVGKDGCGNSEEEMPGKHEDVPEGSSKRIPLCCAKCRLTSYEGFDILHDETESRQQTEALVCGVASLDQRAAFLDQRAAHLDQRAAYLDQRAASLDERVREHHRRNGRFSNEGRGWFF